MLSRGVRAGAVADAVCGVCCDVCCVALCDVSSNVCCGVLCDVSSNVCCGVLCASGVCCGALCGVSSGVRCGALCGVSSGVCCGALCDVCCDARCVVSSPTMRYRLCPSRHGESAVAPRTVGTTSDRAIGRIIRMTLRRCMMHQSYDFCANIRFFFGFFLRFATDDGCVAFIICPVLYGYTSSGRMAKVPFLFQGRGGVRAALSPFFACAEISFMKRACKASIFLNVFVKPSA